jgi:hypothetical protein
MRKAYFWLTATAAMAAISTASPAKAILNYHIYQQGANVIVEGRGSLNLPHVYLTTYCSSSSNSLMLKWDSNNAILCLGPTPARLMPVYKIDTPLPWNNPLFSAYSPPTPSTLETWLAWGPYYVNTWGSSLFGISDPSSAGAINVTTVFQNKDLVTDLGFTTAGLITTWTLQPANSNDPYTANDRINFIVGSPSAPATGAPGPLPLFGSGAAFAWSRRLKRRISQPSRPSQHL